MLLRKIDVDMREKCGVTLCNNCIPSLPRRRSLACHAFLPVRGEERVTRLRDYCIRNLHSSGKTFLTSFLFEWVFHDHVNPNKMN